MKNKSLAIVTGASKGIGKNLVIQLLSKMAVLCIAKDNMSDLGNELGEHPNFFPLEMDLTSSDMINKLKLWFNTEGKEFQVQYLIHNAAILEISRLDDISYGKIIQSFSLNTFAPMLINQFLFKENKFTDVARILYITSSSARLDYGRIYAGLSLYSSSKAAANEIALIQKRECEVFSFEKDILIARAYPGIVMTDMQHYLQSELPDNLIGDIANLPSFSQDMFQETILPKCMIPPYVAATFLVWILTLSKEEYLQSAEFDIYRDEWMKATLITP